MPGPVRAASICLALARGVRCADLRKNDPRFVGGEAVEADSSDWGDMRAAAFVVGDCIIAGKGIVGSDLVNLKTGIRRNYPGIDTVKKWTKFNGIRRF